ncbi:hypothetical protein GS941_26125 [Rhodococcus hoagii]|nr:hypothetical protein [Prescottella equi]
MSRTRRRGASHRSRRTLSSRPLIADLTAAYTRATRRRATPAWAPLPVDYADYARWQHELLDSGIRDSDLGFWEGVLEGAPAVPGWCRWIDPGRQPAARAERVTASLDSEVWTALGTVARGIDATPFMVLHSAVAVLLSAITGTPDTLLGTAESGRNDPLLDELVGMFRGHRGPARARARRCDLPGPRRRSPGVRHRRLRPRHHAVRRPSRSDAGE